MCTLSIIEYPAGGYRVVQNRDEQRSRGAAYPPAWRTLESNQTKGIRVLHPTDSDAGGTWICVNDAGTTTGVLNYRKKDIVNEDASQSRGEIPLLMIKNPDLVSMLQMLQSMDLSVYSCFTAYAIQIVHGQISVLVVEWDATELRIVRRPEDIFTPIAIASSGLGDELVQVRVHLFSEMVTQDPTPEHQDAYHHHRWDDRPEYSVMMSRKNARTVSIVTIDVGVQGTGVFTPIMGYQELPESDPVYDPVGAGMLQ